MPAAPLLSPGCDRAALRCGAYRFARKAVAIHRAGVALRLACGYGSSWWRAPGRP